MAYEEFTGDDTYSIAYKVEADLANRRLDHFLKVKYRKLSREYLQKCIRNGRITVNKKPAKPSQILKVQDEVFVLSKRGKEPEVDFNYKIIYEDDTILVIDKPGNLPVHPSGRFFFNTLLTQLRVEQGNQVNPEKDFFIVHRIDRETSGVLIMGKTSAAAANLVSQFEDRKTDKTYLAIARGVMEKDQYVVDLPLSNDPRSEIRIKMHIAELGRDGEPLFVTKDEVLHAKTEFTVVERFPGFTLVECKPHTGRQHQIRVHLESLGHPLAGDKLYGTEADFFLKSIREIVSVEAAPGIFLTRHALHANRLRVKHPQTKKEMEFVAELPLELKEFLEKIKLL